jgi:hypothetical protein
VCYVAPDSAVRSGLWVEGDGDGQRGEDQDGDEDGDGVGDSGDGCCRAECAADDGDDRDGCAAQGGGEGVAGHALEEEGHGEDKGEEVGEREREPAEAGALEFFADGPVAAAGLLEEPADLAPAEVLAVAGVLDDGECGGVEVGGDADLDAGAGLLAVGEGVDGGVVADPRLSVPGGGAAREVAGADAASKVRA